MSVIVRGSFYREIKQLAHSYNITVGSLVSQLINHEFKLISADSEEFKCSYNSILDIREVGIILNNYTRQINSNITSRKQIDPMFLKLFKKIIDQAELNFFNWRTINYNSFFDDLKITQGGEFDKVNSRILIPKKWHQLHLNLDAFEEIALTNKCNLIGFTQSKYINSLIKLFLNQGNFYDKETKALQGYLNKSLCLIKINARQILKDKKKNAYQDEKNIAQNIVEHTDILLDKLKGDPILYSGRIFDNLRLQTTFNNLANLAL